MKILALDIGTFRQRAAFLTPKLRHYEFFNATTDRRYLSTIFKNYKVDLVVMEACGESDWINDLAAMVT